MTFKKSFKQAFYIEQLKLAGIKTVDGKILADCTERELKYALTMYRAKAS